MHQLCVLGYYQLNINTIVEKYCVNKAKPKLQCNGKCYLSKQRAVQQNTETSNEKGAINVIEAFFPVFFQAVNYQTKPLFLTEIALNWKKKRLHSFDLIYLIDAPPKF